METLDRHGPMLIADTGYKLPCKLEIHQMIFAKLLQTSTEKLFSEELQFYRVQSQYIDTIRQKPA